MKYNVTRYFSGFCTYEIEAKSEEEALAESEKLIPNRKEIFQNLQPWRQCDQINAVKED